MRVRSRRSEVDNFNIGKEEGAQASFIYLTDLVLSFANLNSLCAVLSELLSDTPSFPLPLWQLLQFPLCNELAYPIVDGFVNFVFPKSFLPSLP